MVKVILFDFDGTIADSFDSFIEILDVLTDKYHLNKIPPTELNALRSEDAKTLFKKLKIPIYKMPFLARDMKKLQREKMMEIKAHKNLPEVLQELNKLGLMLGILTSNCHENVSKFLTLNNIDVFKYIYDNASLFGKDRAINRFVKRHNLQKNDLIYVGDEIRDIHACKKAGIKIISVSWGFNSRVGLEKNNPDYLIDEPSQILDTIKKLN